MNKTNELWERFSINSNGVPMMMQGAFRAAIEEYGEHVKGECAKVCEGRIDKDKGLANARLIAAAPELLEALEELSSDEEDEDLKMYRKQQSELDTDEAKR